MSQKSQAEAAAKRTLQRLEEIQKHFDESPRTGRVKGKVAIVTGVGSKKGIGRATALLLAREGAKSLYLLDFNGDDLPELAKDITSRYPDVKVTTVQGDAADDALIEGLCRRALEEEGRLDVFIANAGIATGNVLANVDPDDYLNTLRVNSLSCFLAIKHASAVMKETHTPGSIVLTASVAGLRSGAGSIDYSASKASVISLASLGANQLAGTGIRVNAICPGLIETAMTEFTFDRARERGTLGKVGQLCALRRYGVSEEIASAFLFLASDESSYINGIAMPVDGGLSSSLPVVPGSMF